MDKDKTIVVSGATGSVGGQVVARLAGTSHRIRIIGRDAASLNEVAHRHGAEPHVRSSAAPGVSGHRRGLMVQVMGLLVGMRGASA